VTPEQEREIRALCHLGKLDVLAADFVASDLSLAAVRDLLVTITALQDQAMDGVVDLELLEGKAPAPILAKVHTLLSEIVIHQKPKGQPS
jgi:hypothetical protein